MNDGDDLRTERRKQRKVGSVSKGELDEGRKTHSLSCSCESSKERDDEEAGLSIETLTAEKRRFDVSQKSRVMFRGKKERRTEVGSSRKRRRGFDTSSTPIVSRFLCSIPSPAPGTARDREDSQDQRSGKRKEKEERRKRTSNDRVLDVVKFEQLDDSIDVGQSFFRRSAPRLSKHSTGEVKRKGGRERGREFGQERRNEEID